MTDTADAMRLRLTLAAIGAIAGYFFWALFEYLPDLVDEQRVLMLVGAFAGSLFGGLLLLVGRLGLPVAFRYAAVIALVSALVLFWASYRFFTVEDYFEAGHPVIAFTFLTWLPLPFVMAQETSQSGWRDYEALFDHAWSIFVRTVTVWMFTGLFWLVIFLSDQLLELVGFVYLGELVENLWFSMPLTGAIVGLAMAVLNELKTVVSTLRRLALQLLRLLLPLVAVVVALFIVLVPFQGLEKVFGSLSAAGTMLAMAAGAVTLITSAIDARDEDSAHSRLMVMAAKGLAVLLPLIAGIAVYAIWVRVGQYGWTPPRLSASVIALVVLGYALAYAASVLAGKNWRGHIRTANTWKALVVIVVSVVWLTPVLNVERISANSHVDRFEAGLIGVEDLDVWRLGQNWGKPGLQALGRVRAITGHAEQAALIHKLAEFDKGTSRYAYEHSDDNLTNQQTLADLKAILPVLPEGSELPEAVFADIPKVTIERMLIGCKASLPDGRPGCALVLGEFDPRLKASAAVLFWRSNAGEGTEIVTLERRQPNGPFDYRRSAVALGGDPEGRPADELIGMVLDGQFSFKPAWLNALEIDGIQILPRR